LTSQTEKAWIPDLLFYKNHFETDLAVVCDVNGTISEIVPSDRTTGGVRLKNRALLPGLVNAHSHAFQRVIRGRTEYRSSDQTDSFWTWRELMYHAASQLSPYDIYAASRMAFLEMALGGITTVGEFHYLHNALNGVAYDDPNVIATEVVRAANDVGVRIALLRVAYARSGYDEEPNPRQSRFIELVDHYFDNVEALIAHLSKSGGMAWAGVAPHSVRAVPLEYLKRVVEFGQQRRLPIHMHVAEQPAEVSACIEEYGRSPVALLETEGLLNQHFTAVHAIHVSNKGIHAIAQSGARVCACPTTERNLGDGVVPVDQYFASGVSVSLGTDSQTQIDLFEDARELEYHLRLQRTERNVLAPGDDTSPSAVAKKLFDAATMNGAASLGFNGGTLEADGPCDFFTVDLDDPSIAGASPSDLLPCVIFSLSRAAIKDVVVAGKRIVEDGKHPAQDKIVEAFSGLQKRLWGDQRT
jgi:formimidoylglutamate deiminase